MNNNIMVITGPAGCGKSRNAIAFQRHFQCNRIIDGWSPNDKQKLQAGDLLLTNVPVEHIMIGGSRIIQYKDAVKNIKRIGL